eukprot:CAMPEP_0170874674 /NCGR_PEP_ID=MMETSP0734-20130129/28356_1 /TAXON_ID=186038 /ORGANISM="Fragilariopsis kerguelensis, Strain L26-C5" /LENGTH=112 /DNA_ID=CAMNT_0011255803 /DNA_START=59 /DNA_END=397 /DNA_ORIENTATION=-
MAVTEGENIRGLDQSESTNEPRKLWGWRWNPPVCYWTYSWQDGFVCNKFGAAAAAEEEGSGPTEDEEEEEEIDFQSWWIANIDENGFSEDEEEVWESLTGAPAVWESSPGAP